jgi:DNA-binding HxlR family transcriptional regulator
MKKSYKQYCPIARGAEVFAERWTPVILRNIFVGAETFTQIRDGAPGLPKAVLEKRLAMLGNEGVLTVRPAVRGRGSTYHLTEMGRELVDVCFALGNWGARWLELGPEHLDARVVLWNMAHLVDREALPEDRITVRFDIADARPHSRFWLVLERQSVEVCTRNPGYSEGLIVTATEASLAAWHSGRMSLADARAQGYIEVLGPPRLARAFGSWGRSPFASIPPIVPARVLASPPRVTMAPTNA